MDMFSGETSPEKLFKALMAICKGIFKTRKEQREGLHTVSLAGNTLSDIDAVSSLADFPDILGLDLSNNMIADVKALAKWRNRFPKLESLNLDGNPILEKLEAAVPTFLEKWPRLLRLNHIQIRNPEETAARQAANRPRPIPQLGSNFRDVNGIGEGFVRELIQMYDSDRRSLAAKYYDDQSTFSLSVDNRGHRSASFQPPPWGPYQKVSRNHTKITHPPARRTRAFVGTTQIQSAWAQLPATRHPDLVTNLAKYVVECHPTNGLPDPSGQNPAGVEGMHITIRGEFDDLDPETNKTWTRSFCRTLLLGPGDPARNPIRVISDLLSLKAHSPFKQVTSSAIDLTDEAVKRFHVILELSKETGLNSEYATMCVDAAGGDPSKIIALFQEQKDSLPAEAFAAVAYTKWPTS